MPSLQHSLKVLSLDMPFTLEDLKSAYRKASFRTHPDRGGSNALFVEVSDAYEYLKFFVETNRNCQRTTNNYTSHKPASKPKQQKKKYKKPPEETRQETPEEIFKKEWRKALELASRDNSGLWFGTTLTRLVKTRGIEPEISWFNGCLFGSDSAKNRKSYKEFLFKVAPNKQFRESWAAKYFELEFGDRVGF